MMTKLITIPKFAEATGLPYRLCLHLVETGQIPSVRCWTPLPYRRTLGGAMVGRWRLSPGWGTLPRRRGRRGQFNPEMLTTAD